MRPAAAVLTGPVSVAAAALLLAAAIRGRGGEVPAPDGGPGAPLVLIEILSPLPGAVFPADMAPPTFRWKDDRSGATSWTVEISMGRGKQLAAEIVQQPAWTPSAGEWEAIRRESTGCDARLTVLGAGAGGPGKVLSQGHVDFRTSVDPVGAPLLYREVNLPFLEAVKDPSKIRWRFGSVSSRDPPPVVLEGLPVCGNCHSFPAAGDLLAMDVDYANDKGSYVIARVSEEMALATSDIITWDAFRKEDRVPTFGLLSQISPDGACVASTVKDRSVFVPRPDLAFSQLFFPIQGILAIYSRQAREFAALPGADDPGFVQSNPAWSPDGRWIVFARSAAYRLRRGPDEGKVLLSAEDCSEFVEEGKPFRFDLYRIPFGGGKGGTPEPLAGASGNGMSNYFPRYSPDGKWIVFCKARSYMLLQPDSKLWIVPAAGGEARELSCNTARMNSWHSWSPNGRWLVFSSKANSPFTQLFLAHIDEDGRSAPPVLLDRFTASDRAANIPEFINASPTAIRRIREDFLDDYSFVRAGHELFKAGDAGGAIDRYREALRRNPNSVEAHLKLGFLLYHVKGEHDEGMRHSLEALRLDPADGAAHYEVGMALLHQKSFEKAAAHLAEAVRRLPRGRDFQYKPAEMRLSLATALLHQGELERANGCLDEAASLDPENAAVQYELAKVLAARGRIPESVEHLGKALKIQPEIDTAPELHGVLASHFAKRGQMRAAIASAERALKLARAAGREDLVRELERRLERYRGAAPK